MSTEHAEPSRRRLGLLWGLTVAALALHNMEESLLGLNGWMAEHAWFPGRALHGDDAQLTLALAIVTAAVFLLAVFAVVRRPAWSAEVLACVAYALAINAIGHLVLSVVSMSFMPGVFTGTFVLLPLSVGVVRSLPAVWWRPTAVAITVAAAVGAVVGSLLLAAAFNAIR